MNVDSDPRPDSDPLRSPFTGHVVLDTRTAIKPHVPLRTELSVSARSESPVSCESSYMSMLRRFEAAVVKFEQAVARLDTHSSKIT